MTMTKCEKCGAILAPADFVPCDLETEDCPLLADYNRALRRVLNMRCSDGEKAPSKEG